MQTSAEVRDAKVRQWQLSPEADGLQLSASLDFGLGQALQDALHKGVPLHFVARADVRSPRWYWRDGKIARVERRMRLSYSPLSRRWQLTPLHGGGSAEVNLRLTYASLDEALVAVRHINSWTIAPAQRLKAGQDYEVHFHFYLDLAQLPKPFQIGLNAQSEWKIDARASRKGVWPALPMQ